MGVTINNNRITAPERTAAQAWGGGGGVCKMVAWVAEHHFGRSRSFSETAHNLDRMVNFNQILHTNTF